MDRRHGNASRRPLNPEEKRQMLSRLTPEQKRRMLKKRRSRRLKKRLMLIVPIVLALIAVLVLALIGNDAPEKVIDQQAAQAMEQMQANALD